MALILEGNLIFGKTQQFKHVPAERKADRLFGVFNFIEDVTVIEVEGNLGLLILQNYLTLRLDHARK